MSSCFMEYSAYIPIIIVGLLSGLRVIWYASAAERSAY